jgi:PAS domain S-box-containing protein
VGRVWSFRDVTTAKKAEKAVLEREQLLRKVIDLVPHYIFAKDRQSRTLFTNRARADANGMTPEEMVGRSDRDFVADPEQSEAFMRDDREVIESGKPKFIPEERITLRDGSVRILETLKVPFTMPGSDEPALLGVAVDITERIKAEEAVKHERQLLRQLIDLMPDFIFVKDTESRFLVVNDSLAKSYGQSPEAMLQHTDSDFLPAKLAAGFRASELRVMAADSFLPLEDTIAFPDGKMRTVVTNMVALRDGQGKVLGLVGIGRDVTQSKMDRTRQHLLEEQLRQAQKMEAIGQLAGGVAHDFNNILAVIQMQAELFKMDATASEEQAACLHEIQTAANRGANLTRQLLLFSRRQRLQPRELDLSDSITAMTKMLRRVLGEDIQIQFKYAPQPLIIQADAGMIDQVLMNLTLNSRDAMPAGGQLVIETAAVEMDALAVLQSPQARPGSFVRLSVSDNGCGIAPEILPRIFEPFFTTKDVGKGTGLGLATVFSIVEQHEGWINVASEPGRGTTFDLYLPRLARTSAPAAEPAANLAAVKGGGETILLVEDDDALRESVRRCLSQLGYRLLEAASGAAALEVWQLHRHEIQLLLTDLIMPGGMTGRELGERLQQENPRLAVIYVSGYSADIFTRDFPAAPGITFLAKPFPAHTLAQTVRARLDGPSTG